MKITPKNWRDFQHYKDRNPPWIRLHKSLLDNFEFQSLPVASRALAPMLWLLASDSVDGVIDAAPEKLAFRLRMTVSEVRDALKPLIDNDFFSVDSDTLAECKQSAVPEAESEALQKEPSVLPAPSLRAVPVAPPAFDGSNLKAIPAKAVVPLAPNFDLPEEWGVDAEALGFPRSKVLFESERFRQFWAKGKGAQRRKSLRGWRQAWSNWLGKAAERAA